MRHDQTPHSSSHGYFTVAALAFATMAFAVAGIAGFTPLFAGMPISPVLFVLGLAVGAWGFRELSVRSQFAERAGQHAAALAELEDKNR